MRSRLHHVLLAWLFLLLLPLVVSAKSPLVAPGDYQFRHDIQLLSDYGLLSGPVTMWPVTWSQIDSELTEADLDRELPRSVAAALARVQSELRRVKREGGTLGMELRGASDTPFIRSFDDEPRGEAEAEVSANWLGERFAWSLRASYVDDDPRDDQEWRFDGSWLGMALGNWMLAAGAIERHWGPGWQGGLAVSNNARPRPGVTLRRLRAMPFETQWLSWLGPWNFSVFVERLEEDRGVSNALLTGMRFAFRPFESLELGITRTVMFGGEGNDVGLDTVANILTGQTTSTNRAAGGDDDYDQMAGFDARWNVPYVNAALYGEMIGEDESGSRPNLFMGQGGVEFWGGLGEQGSWRLILERADTKADILDTSEREGDAEFGIAYNNAQFPTGHRYRGRIMGHPAESDALLTSVRLLLSFESSSFNLAYLDGDLNRADGPNPNAAAKNTLTTRGEDVKQISMSWEKQYYFGHIELGIGRAEREPSGSGLATTDGYAWVGFGRSF